MVRSRLQGQAGLRYRGIRPRKTAKNAPTTWRPSNNPERSPIQRVSWIKNPDLRREGFVRLTRRDIPEPLRTKPRTAPATAASPRPEPQCSARSSLRSVHWTARSLRDRSLPRRSCPVPAPCRSSPSRFRPRPGSSVRRHAWNGTPPSPRNADPASARSARSAPTRSSGKQRPALFSDPPCLMHFHGSRGRREPLPATPFMAGSGGGWIVSALVLQDRE